MNEEDKKKRNRRSIVIALILVGFVVLFYAITIIRLGEQVANRQM